MEFTLFNKSRYVVIVDKGTNKKKDENTKFKIKFLITSSYVIKRKKKLIKYSLT